MLLGRIAIPCRSFPISGFGIGDFVIPGLRDFAKNVGFTAVDLIM